MKRNCIIPKTINPDLQKERENASFNVEEFAKWWHGGEEKLKFKRFLDSYILDYVDGNEVFRNQHLAHDEIYSNGIKSCFKVAATLRKIQEKYNPGGTDIWPGIFNNTNLWGALPPANPFSVHFAMVVEGIRIQGTDEQFEKFGKRAENLEIFCAYAQTELGHGTYLRGLETRADFDHQTDEFVLNTPTISAYKWWPGGLGHTANYCILLANLYIDNIFKDLVMFLVQIRDEKTHMPLPGIDVGDIGKKMGFAAANNGYLGLKNVRIPRTQMLMRHTKVLRDGTFVKSPNTALTYFPLAIGRCVSNETSTALLTMAATIATRYSAVRRQCPIHDSEPERQIIDHATQQLKLFPEIATSIAYKLSTLKLWQLFHQTTQDVKRGEYAGLPEMHSLSCCLKVLCTSDSMFGVERLRLACGGHGYLSSSNLGTIYVDGAAACTYEGENTVLLLTVARFLMKFYRMALAGEQLPPSANYLREAIQSTTTTKWTGYWENIVKVLQIIAANKIRGAFEHLLERLKAGQTESEAFNNTGIELTQAAELHGRCFVASTFFEEVTGAQAKTRTPALTKVLQNLLELFLVNTALLHLNEILLVISISDSELSSLQIRLESALKAIRPDAVAICDGFDLHDRNLSSTLGSYDGNVYERIFEAAKNNPLNEEPVPKVFHTHMKPFMKSKI